MTIAEPLQVLHITDCHLFAEPEGRLLGMNTMQSLDRVLALVASERETPDLLLLTGDLAQDGSRNAYEHLVERFASFSCPIVWFMGNHDHAATMEQVARPLGVLQRRMDLGGWTFLCLDSSRAGRVDGELTDADLEWLANELKQCGGQHVLIVLHHHPVPVGSRWLDAIGLRNPAPLLNLVSRHRHVRGVLWGHVHQAFDEVRDGVRYLATPSTCIQFKPGSEAFALDVLPPGYRRLSLAGDGGINTDVVRVANFEFDIDLNSRGY